MSTIVEAIAAAIISFLGKWLGARQAQRTAQKSAIAIQSAEVHESTDRDATDNQVEADRGKSNEELTKAAADSAGPDGLRKQSQDINAAIAVANRSMR